MAIIKKQTKITASGAFKQIAINVEAQGIPLSKSGDDWSGKRDIEFDDQQINVRITIKGEKNADYEVKIIIDDVTKTIKGTLTKSGINHIPEDYSLSDFNLSL